ncbi:MAG: carbohydrate-binding protein [Bacteroidaceae bacterium]|nr:carbohydrate-binding protein [Bacteroidaceae bacterium]
MSVSSKNLCLFALSLFLSASVYAFEDGQVVRLIRGGRSLMVENSSLDASKNAVLWTETNTHSQRWMLVDTGKGTFYLQNVYSQLYLGGVSAANNNAVVGQIAKNVARGTWELVPVEGSDNKYNIFIGTVRRFALSSVEEITDGTGVRLLTASTADPALIEWEIEVDENVEPHGFSKSMRDDMMEKFKARHYKKQSTGYSIDNGGWWGDAEMFETILDAYETTGNQEYATMFENLYTNFISRNKSTWYQSGVSGYNEYNDDIAWMCIACVRAYLLTGTSKYLSTAKTNFDGMFKRADCYGNDLLQWKHNSGTGTNACINGPASVCACYLAIATADMSYYEKAKKTYLANRNRLYEFSNGQPTGKVWDSYDQGKNSYNYWASTYNQGTCLGAALMLYDYYNDPMYKTDADAIIKWSVKELADSHGIIKVCQTVRGDLCGFKGILMRYIRRYAEDMNHPEYYDWLAKNGYHAWNNRNSGGITSSAWLTKSEEDYKHQEGEEIKTFESFGNSTCLSAAFNAHLGVVEHHDAYEPIQAENFFFIKNANIKDNGNTDDGTGEISNMRNSNNVGYKNVDFGTSFATHITVRANFLRSVSKLNVYADAPDAKKGTLLCTLSSADADAGINKWETYRKVLNIPVTGVHRIYFVATGTNSVNLLSVNWFQFQSELYVFGDMTNNGGQVSSSLEITDGTLQTLVDDNVLSGFTGLVTDVSDVYVQYHSPAPIKLMGYSLYSGLQAYDPISWTLKASNDGTNWDVIHTQADTAFAVRAQQIRYDVESSIPYIYYRLCFTLPEAATQLSLSEWQLLGSGISPTDITADGGYISDMSYKEVSDNLATMQAIIDHEGKYTITSPLTATYKSNGNYTITSYAIMSTTGKAPTAWTLEGSNNGTTWKVIDQQSGIEFPYTASTYICNVESAPTYQYYQLKIQEEDTEISQWQLYGNYDFGTFYADVMSFADVSDADSNPTPELADNNGETYSTIEGESLHWNIIVPVPVKVVGFSMLCADNPDFDPTNVTLFGVNENGNITQIVNKTVSFNARAGRATYTITSTQFYKTFRLAVNQTTSEGSVARLAEVELFGTAIAEDESCGAKFPANVEASAESVSSTESIEKISDHNRGTRYRTGFTEPVSITCSYDGPVQINCYTVTSAKDTPANDPKDWVLEGSNDGTEWIIVDSRVGETFSNRYTTQVYMLPELAGYSKYRLTVSAVNGGTQVHIGELQFLNLEEWYLDEGKYTSLRSVAEQTVQPGHGIFDLSGRKVNTSQLKKGIYIIGGKKVLVR